MSQLFLKAALATAAAMTSLVGCTPKAQNAVELTKDNSGIIGGTRVAKADVIAKSTVGLIVMFKDHKGEEGQYLCTGTLIKEDVLLTAAHCIPDPAEFVEAGIVLAFSGDLNTLDEYRVRYAADVIAHPYYGSGNMLGQDSNDLALIRFEGGLPSGYGVAQFLEDESALKTGTTVTLAGYGLNKTDGVNTENDNTLRKTDVKIYDNFGKTEVLLDQSAGQGACHGDSGGPAFIEVNGAQYVWGVTSRGAGKNNVDDCSLFAVYTKIKSQRVFIDAALTYLEANKTKN